MSSKPSLPKGTRDILPQSMLQREYILKVVKEVFKKYGFQPIETPAMEKASTLTGKYGEEGDRLIFKVLPRGDKLKKQGATIVPDEALRYDLTVPFARFVVQHQNDIQFPFKRYQIQPVWRADRPQKGRYREFYQCDADVVGSRSLLLELDFVKIYDEVFKKLGIQASIKINNRKVLAGLAEFMQIENRIIDFTISLDKLDKVGVDGVLKDLDDKGFDEKVKDTFLKIVSVQNENFEARLKVMQDLLADSNIGKEGLDELGFVFKNTPKDIPLNLELTLARGLDYYTGSIFEVTADGVALGSIGGGGRYDDLTGIFGLKNLPGIGISFGLDRIQLVMEELNAFPEMTQEATKVLFINFGLEEALFSQQIADTLRQNNIKAEVYPDSSKIGKQMDYANKKSIQTVVLIGSAEMKTGALNVKNMVSGEQKEMTLDQLISALSLN
jgi:histidyl-tRNA synthetase